MDKEKVRIWAAFVIVCIVWGSTWMAIKIGLETIPPFFAAGVRFVIAAVLLFLIIRVRGIAVPFDRNAWRVYLALGIPGYAIPFALVYWGQQYIPSALSSILFAAFPFWVAIFSHVLLRKERLDSYKIGGIVVGFVGLLVIFARDVHWTGIQGLWGMSAVLLSTALGGFSLVVVKKYGMSISPFSLNFVAMGMTAILLLGLSLMVEGGADVVWNTPAVVSVLYLAVISSVLTFVVYFWLLRKVEAVYLSLTTFVSPIIAILLGAIFMGENLAPTVYIGAGLVLSGILFANGGYLYARIQQKT
ncbi:MAG: EamA family transporter [Bacteroidota bacterium]